jgi:DNA-directed RNA polymerase specialized sigma24 family protein
VARALGDRSEAVLARFVAARDAGDRPAAVAAWEELLALNVDRVRAMVALWGGSGRLSADEREDAVQRALVKLWRNMVSTFAGGSMGEWVNAVRTCVNFASTDVQREAAQRTSRAAPLEDGDSVAEESFARNQEKAEAAEFVAWALPRVEDERRRLVLARTLDGAPAAAIDLRTGDVIADPFQPTAALVALLRLRAEHLHGPARSPGGRRLRLRPRGRSVTA